MAPIDLKLGQNAFQVIPELSLFDVEDRKISGFFGHDHFVLARTHVSWVKTHVSWPKTAQDTCVLAQNTCVLAQDTCVLMVANGR